MNANLTRSNKPNNLLLRNLTNLFLTLSRFLHIMQKKTKKLLKKLQQTQKTIKQFIINYFKNYQSMKKKLAKIWFIMCAVTIVAATITSCNVTRKVTTESTYYQNGDTATTIVTKTIESYDATKKGM